MSHFSTWVMRIKLSSSCVTELISSVLPLHIIDSYFYHPFTTKLCTKAKNMLGQGSFTGERHVSLTFSGFQSKVLYPCCHETMASQHTAVEKQVEKDVCFIPAKKQREKKRQKFQCPLKEHDPNVLTLPQSSAC